MIFNEKDWYELAELFNGIPGEFQLNPDGTRKFDARGRVLRAPYTGYKPHVAEAPNGDTRIETCSACNGSGDQHKLHFCRSCGGKGVRAVPNVAPPSTRYLHVAPKYSPPAWAMAYLARAHYEACRVAEALGVPAAYYPRVADGTLRVLDYDVGGSQPEHTDPDLFTVLCYRSAPDDLEVMHRHTVTGDLAEAHRRVRGLSPEYAKTLHVGELGELVGLGPATPHRVPARPYCQQSIVYFAMPDHAVRLPCAECGAGKMWACRAGQTVGEWLNERLARSRVYK